MGSPVIGVVTNPNSRKNRLDPNRYAKMREVVGQWGLVRRTKDTDAIAEVVREFLDQGVRYWVADGGDGAFHWLMNTVWTVLRERGSDGPWPLMLPTNAGTIDFVGRKAGVIGGCDQLLPELVRLLQHGQQPDSTLLGTFVVRGTFGPNADRPGKSFEKLGFAAALAGIGQRFFDKFYAHDRQDAVGIGYLIAKILSSQASRTMPLRWVPLPVEWRYYGENVFEPMPAQVWLDGELLPFDQFRDLDIGAIDINLANLFRFFSMAKAGEALHVQCGDLKASDVLLNLPRMMRGQELSIDQYVQRPVKTLRAVPQGGRTIDPVIDGELYWGLADVEVSLGPLIPVVKLEARL